MDRMRFFFKKRKKRRRWKKEMMNKNERSVREYNKELYYLERIGIKIFREYENEFISEYIEIGIKEENIREMIKKYMRKI